MNLAITTALVVGMWSAADTGAQTWAALSGSTANTGNAFSAGTVALTDNDGGSTPMFTFTNQRPGVVDNSCIRVNYAGTLSATVKLYGSIAGTLAPYVNVTVTRGTDSSPAFDSCTSFIAGRDQLQRPGQRGALLRAAVVVPDQLRGRADGPGGLLDLQHHASYRISVQIADDNAAQGLSSTATFTWEARS